MFNEKLKENFKVSIISILSESDSCTIILEYLLFIVYYSFIVYVVLCIDLKLHFEFVNCLQKSKRLIKSR